MVDTVIAFCEILGALAAITISLALLGIALGKIDV
jgi:hypothetical protein